MPTLLDVAAGADTTTDTTTDTAAAAAAAAATRTTRRLRTLPLDGVAQWARAARSAEATAPHPRTRIVHNVPAASAAPVAWAGAHAVWTSRGAACSFMDAPPACATHLD